LSYIDGFVDREKNIVHVVERTPQGERKFVTHPTQYVVYWPQDGGKYTSIYGDKLNRFRATRNQEFQRELKVLPGARIFESDINPMFRCLYQNYRNQASPSLHVGFFDIETDYSPDRGYSAADEAFNPITAISVYLNWMQRCFTLVLKPKTWTMAQAHAVCEQFPDTMLCETEHEMLDMFLGLIEDCDVISGWNSSTYDIPYIYNRIIQQLGKEQTRRLCLWNKLPQKREFLNYGKKQITYELQGRVHLDYLDLYRKHTYQELHSYKLDFVGEIDTGERKIPYEGSLDTLYNKDFKKFIEYNRQDVMLLVKIDAKRKLIELCNNLAHQNCVLLATTRGSVALIDQAIVNDAWDQGLVVPNRRAQQEPEDSGDFEQGDEDEEDGGADEKHGIVGAYVAEPKTGMHEHIGGVDITSLYPSAIRALNMSPETIVGHIRPEYTDKLIRKRMHQEKKKFSEAWGGLFSTLEFAEVHNQSDMPLVVDFEKGGTVTVTAAEMYKLVFLSKKPWILSANGTIFTTEKLGVIPGLLARWFTDRMKLQAQMNKFGKLADEATDPEQKSEYTRQRIYYDQLQLIQKILLNSTYGALANEGSRFFDERIAQSVTLTGRSIVKHMGSKINEIITGEYDNTGDACLYSDTDSQYFSSYLIMKDQVEFGDFSWSRENVIDLYDKIAALTNESFPAYMQEAFHCPEANGKLINAARELCASRGIFIKKKRYAVLIFDKDGKRKDKNGSAGEIKAMGLDLKRSDTPKIVQDFLSAVLLNLLTGTTQQDLMTQVAEFRKVFADWPGWQKGTPKRVNKLSFYRDAKKNNETLVWGAKSKRVNLPGHVLASLNWNQLKKLYSDPGSMEIQDGSKVIVCKLRDNPLGMTSVAYPIDQDHLPEWFRQLPFDHDAMETALIDKKVHNLLSALGWDLSQSKRDSSFSVFFS
jgi:DNA polymerase elongation subunit (family B)